ncbi:MAG: hypothetical protein ACRDHM_02900, partial [Actinomycetota bacterium]
MTITNISVALSMEWGGMALPSAVTAEKQWPSAVPLAEPTRLVRPVFKVAVDRHGAFFVLAELPEPARRPYRQLRLLRADSHGVLTGITGLTVEEPEVIAWQVTEFTPDHRGGVYLLEALQRRDQEVDLRLRRVSEGGATRWVRQLRHDSRSLDYESLTGRFEDVLAPDGESVYLPSRYPVPGLVRLDPDTGGLVAGYDFGEPHDRLAIDRLHRVFYARRVGDGDDQRTVLIRRVLETGNRDVIQPGLA